MRWHVVAGLMVAAALAWPGAPAEPAPAAHESPAAFVAYGKQLLAQTDTLMPHNVGAALQCTSCHIAAGTVAHGLSLRTVYAAFPMWNARAARYITLEDRIAECFLYSMNGKPPAYESREMIAMVAYIASLSTGVPLGRPVAAEQTLSPLAAPAGNATRGGALFAQRCAMCHGAGGGGTPAAPPVWGARSFNTGAGMHRHDVMAAFVRANMPAGFPPNTLSAQQSADVAAFILRHARPKFNGAAPVIFQPEPAHFF